MPISKELLDQLSAISEADLDDATLKQLEGKPIYQQIFNRGHASSSGTSKQKVEDAQTKQQEAENKLTTLQAEYDEYKRTTPNVATVEGQYKDKIEKLEKQIATMKEAAKNEKIATRVGSVISRVREILKETVDPIHAESLVDRESVRSRVSSEDGVSAKILQPGLQIPYAGDDEAQAKALAKELAKDVPAKFLLTGVERGTGNGASGGQGPKGKARFDRIRESVKPKEGADKTPAEVQLKRALGKPV